MAQPTTIRVLIADDHAMVRRGLVVFLATCDDLKLVGEAANGREALHLCAELQPDVVLMDLMMPEMDGVAATQAICRAYPHIRVLALTSFGDDDLVQAALRAGAVGYLFKNVSINEIERAIHTAGVVRPAT